MMTEVARLDTVTGISWETGIIMMINRNRLVHKWQEKSLMHQSFLYIQPTTLPNVFRVDFEETLIGEYLQFAV